MAACTQARTKIDPLNGGGHAKGYKWEQTPTDVSIMFEVRAGAGPWRTPHRSVHALAFWRH